MTPPFGLMMFWLPEMRMRPLWMSAMRRPRMPQTMLVVLVRVAVTVTTLMHQGKNEKFLVCQQGPIGDEIGTLGVRAGLHVLIFD